MADCWITIKKKNNKILENKSKPETSKNFQDLTSIILGTEYIPKSRSKIIKNDMIPEPLRKKFIEKRLLSGLSQKELSIKLDIPENIIMNIENGSYYDYKICNKIKNFLGIIK